MPNLLHDERSSASLSQKIESGYRSNATLKMNGGFQDRYRAISRVYALVAESPELECSFSKPLSELADDLECKESKRRSHLLSEAHKAQDLTHGFDSAKSPAWNAICTAAGCNLVLPELIKIACSLAELPNIRLAAPTRCEKRHKDALIKWFEDNWEIIAPIWETAELMFEASNGQPR
jgi:hypothetical protein